MPIELKAAADDDGRRLDRILRKALRDLPLSAIHRLLRKGLVLVDGGIARADQKIRAGQTITLNADTAGLTGPAAGGAQTNDRCKPEIIFEGAGLLVLNKPAGLAVHGANSLEDQVLSYLGPKLPRSLSFRPGPLHRLDRPSSGIIVFSASLEGARWFSALMRNRLIKKFYLALVTGNIRDSELWEDELVRDRRLMKTFAEKPAGRLNREDGKTAITRITPLAGNGASTLLLAEIKTGRTHQIRAQAAFRGHPLLGDKKYGGGFPAGDKAFPKGILLLHAWRQEFPEEIPDELPEEIPDELPLETRFPRVLEAPLPEYFKTKIRELSGKDLSGLL